MTVGELRKAISGIPDYAEIMIYLHNLEGVDDIVSITGVEVFDSGDDADPKPIHLEMFHAYSDTGE